MGLVFRTGFLSARGQLIRSILFPRPLYFKFYSDAYRFLGIMTLLAVFGFVFSVVEFIHFKAAPIYIFLRAIDLITICVPPVLPIIMTVSTTFAVKRLSAEGMYLLTT